jgi:hypothetical protein
MKKIGIALVLPVLILFGACNKDQKVVKQLDGEWKVTSMTYGGTAAPAEVIQNNRYKFTDCKVKKQDCSGERVINDEDKGPMTLPFTYNISEKGTKVAINTNFMGFITTIKGDIKEATKTKFVFSYDIEQPDPVTGMDIKIEVVETLEKI